MNPPAFWLDADPLGIRLPAVTTFLSPEACSLVLTLVDDRERTLKRAGLSLSTEFEQLRGLVSVAASDYRAGQRDNDSEQSSIMDPITTRDAAILLDCSERTVRRRVNAGALGPFRRTGRGEIILDRQAVTNSTQAGAA